MAKHTLPEIRKQIETLKATRKTIERSPRSRSEARADLDRQCASWARAGSDQVSYRVGMLAHGSPINELFRAGTGYGYVDLGPVLASLLGPERMAATLAVHLERWPDGISAADRAAQLADIDRQLLAAEIAEESLIEAAEAAGMSVVRRGDADPRAVMAVPVAAGSAHGAR